MSASVQGLLQFLSESPTAFHAAAAAASRLEAAGYRPLHEREVWQLEPGGRYYVTRNGSALIAFRLPEDRIACFQLAASHTDSPTFKVKENAEISVRDRYIQLDTERYGGMIFSSWFDRPLSVAGRVVVRENGELRVKLIRLDRDMCVIPNVAIHMNREVNSGYKYQAHVDLMPLWGMGGKGTFRQVIAGAAGVDEQDLVGNDLFLYSRMPGTVWGEGRCFVSAGRLDDLECVYTSLTALLASGREPERDGTVRVCAFFDNEEVGSTTRQGADSTFLRDVLRRIALCGGLDEQAWQAALAGSLLLSADNAHAVHPNHPEYADPVNSVWMNRGVVVKHNANQKYTTDAVSAAAFREICRRAGVETQDYFNRSDIAGGSTLGNISGSHVSIASVDIGLAQLAMHSCWETAGCEDVDSMIRALTAFYDTPVRLENDRIVLGESR